MPVARSLWSPYRNWKRNIVNVAQHGKLGDVFNLPGTKFRERTASIEMFSVESLANSGFLRSVVRVCVPADCECLIM